MAKSINYYLKNPLNLILRFVRLGIIPMDDEKFLKMEFRRAMGYELNLKSPRTFNEKLQWLKLYDRRPEYTTMVDKHAVKDYVASKIGEEYIIPTLGVWDRFDDIDFEKLPNKFVLKCTHDSGSLVICKDKKTLDFKTAKKKLEKCLKRNYYYTGREWPYKNVKPRIIAEKYMEESSGQDIKDYKIFNFSGEPRIIQVDFDRFINHKRNLYTISWDYLNKEILFPSDSTKIIEKPKQLDKMLELARTLSCDIPHVRSDFYCIDDKIYFGELTFYHGSGFEEFRPESFGVELGNYITLPEQFRGGYLIFNTDTVIWIHEYCPKELADYKLMCFNGKHKCTFTCTERFSQDGLKVTFFDDDWNKMPFERHYPVSSKRIDKPLNYEKMVELAETLSKDIPFMRVDFYEVNGKVYFGELTFYPGSGFEEFEPSEWDEKLGGWLEWNCNKDFYKYEVG